MVTSSSQSRAITLMVGLPHLRSGPLLARARSLALPVLVSANAFSRWVDAAQGREWAGWKLQGLKNATRLHSLCLDSAGFSAMTRYGGFPWTIDDYVALASAFPFRWWASLDYCVEQEVARDREEVLDRIARTVRANIECHARAVDRNIASTFLPVIQGRLPQDYERCATALAGLVERHTLIGVGSMCRRPIHGDAGLIAVVDHLDRVLPPAVRLHLFGVKGAAIPFLKPFARRVASIDSQAYGIAARSKARAHGCRKSDDLVADEMERWVEQQRARLRQPARALPIAAPAIAPPLRFDPWEEAIAQAREDLRALIESGDLDHDAPVTGWVEQWAADLMHVEA